MAIAPAPDSEPETLSFDWEIIEYTESYVVIQLLFENPEALSALDGKSMDQVQVTFWGDNLFVGKNGKSVPNGVTIRREVVRQVDPAESAWIIFAARACGYGILAAFVLLGTSAKMLRADTYPVWSVVNTLMLVTHFPLLYLQLPGSISLWMKEFLAVLRLQDLQIERLLFWWGVTGEYDPAWLADRGHNIYFEQLGYNSRYVVRNCAVILCLLALSAAACVIAFIVERIRGCRDKSKRGLGKASFQVNGRVKMYRPDLFHLAVQGFTRILQVAFL